MGRLVGSGLYIPSLAMGNFMSWRRGQVGWPCSFYVVILQLRRLGQLQGRWGFVLPVINSHTTSLSGASPSACSILALASQHFQRYQRAWTQVWLKWNYSLQISSLFCKKIYFHKADLCIEKIVTRQLPTWPVLAQNTGITLLFTAGNGADRFFLLSKTNTFFFFFFS